MNAFDIDPKGYLPVIQPLIARLLVRLGLRTRPQHNRNVTCCA